MTKHLKTQIVVLRVINDLTLLQVCLQPQQILEVSPRHCLKRILSLSYLDESLLDEVPRDKSNSLSNQKDLDLKLSNKTRLTNLHQKEDSLYSKKLQKRG